MILNKDINPEHSLYFIGSLILNELISSRNEKFDYLELYRGIQNNHVVSMNIFTLSLDWLYLNGVVDIDKGKIKKCF
ncbi:ABC-three component system middle component 6 [Tenacibaculum geojense]|uniref:ABC-three component system middle component 6 n=1 Tax=Tenacibaculum geojense TaxID=915352 RepID=A0ABW3JP43_9FLAO